MKKYFKDISNLITFGLTIIPAILLYIFQPSEKVPYLVFVITLFAVLFFAWLSIKFYLDLCDKTAPSVDIISCSNDRCICKPNGLIAHNSIVSFHQSIGDYERLIGYGVVETITKNGFAQIIPKSIPGSNIENIYEYLNDNQPSIIVRPTVTIDMLSTLQK